nr:tudor domain-containing protein 7A [Leptinotarsa decemlineata]
MDNIKKYITSLLTSTPLSVTMQQLNRDYRDTIGEPIPYQKFGFNSLEHFLRSIPEIVQIRGSGPCAEVIPVESEKSSHVMELVSNQKRSTSRKKYSYYGRRTVISAKKEYWKHYQQHPEEHRARIQYPNVSCQQPNNRPIDLIKLPVNYSMNENHIKTSENTNKIKIINLQGELSTSKKSHKVNNNVCDSSLLQNGENKVVKHVESLKTPEIVKDIQNCNKFSTALPKTSVRSHKKKPHHSERTKPPLENFENFVPQTVQNNLKILIGQYPNGIWCANIPEVYRCSMLDDIKNKLIVSCINRPFSGDPLQYGPGG